MKIIIKEKIMKTYEEFLKALCQREASGNYKAANPLGYKGCYQMGDQLWLI